MTNANTNAEIITAEALPSRKPGQIDNLYSRRQELRTELEELEAAIQALESNPEVARLLTIVTRAVANRGERY